MPPGYSDGNRFATVAFLLRSHCQCLQLVPQKCGCYDAVQLQNLKLEVVKVTVAMVMDMAT
jgi:hypothetical protein